MSLLSQLGVILQDKYNKYKVITFRISIPKLIFSVSFSDELFDIDSFNLNIVEISIYDAKGVISMYNIINKVYYLNSFNVPRNIRVIYQSTNLHTCNFVNVINNFSRIDYLYVEGTSSTNCNLLNKIITHIDVIKIVDSSVIVDNKRIFIIHNKYDHNLFNNLNIKFMSNFYNEDFKSDKFESYFWKNKIIKKYFGSNLHNNKYVLAVFRKLIENYINNKINTKKYTSKMLDIISCNNYMVNCFMKINENLMIHEKNEKTTLKLILIIVDYCG